jgi:hypothetical protein
LNEDEKNGTIPLVFFCILVTRGSRKLMTIVFLHQQPQALFEVCLPTASAAEDGDCAIILSSKQQGSTGGTVCIHAHCADGCFGLAGERSTQTFETTCCKLGAAAGDTCEP